MRRGDVYDADVPGVGRRPVVIVTRDVAIPLLTSVTVVEVTGTIRGIPSEVELGDEEGLDESSVANCDNLFTIPKRALDRRRGELGPVQTGQLNAALRLALELDR